MCARVVQSGPCRGIGVSDSGLSCDSSVHCVIYFAWPWRSRIGSMSMTIFIQSSSSWSILILLLKLQKFLYSLVIYNIIFNNNMIIIMNKYPRGRVRAGVSPLDGAGGDPGCGLLRELMLPQTGQLDFAASV